MTSIVKETSDFLDKFPERLKKILKEKNIKQKEIARVLGISDPTVSNYVKGKSIPNAVVMITLAKTLSVSLEFLMLGKKEE